MKVSRNKGVELENLEVGEILKEDDLVLKKRQELEEMFNKQYYDSLRKIDRDRKIMTIIGIVVCVTISIAGIFAVLSNIKFENKVLQEYDKCIRINEELFCKVEK